MDNKKEKYYTYKLNMKVLNVLAIILFIVLLLAVVVLEYGDNYIIYTNIGVLLILVILWLMLHELLHAIGFMLFKEVKWKNIVFGIKLESGVFYCMCKQKNSKKVILTSLMFPITFIGIFTLIIGMIINSYLLVYLSILNIVGSIGDIVMSFYFFKAPSDIIYLDLDDCTSFTVLSHKNLEKLKVFGIELIDEGLYDSKKIHPSNYQKIKISKASYLILGLIIFISCLFSFLH